MKRTSVIPRLAIIFASIVGAYAIVNQLSREDVSFEVKEKEPACDGLKESFFANCYIMTDQGAFSINNTSNILGQGAESLNESLQVGSKHKATVAGLDFGIFRQSLLFTNPQTRVSPPPRPGE